MSVTPTPGRLRTREYPRKAQPLQWRHNGHDGVSNYQRLDCLLNYLFRHRSKKTSKLRVTGLWEGNSLGIGEFPAQKTSNAENVSIWWRHHIFEDWTCERLQPQWDHNLFVAKPFLKPTVIYWQLHHLEKHWNQLKIIHFNISAKFITLVDESTLILSAIFVYVLMKRQQIDLCLFDWLFTLISLWFVYLCQHTCEILCFVVKLCFVKIQFLYFECNVSHTCNNYLVSFHSVKSQ